MIIKKNIVINQGIQYVYGTLETNREDQSVSYDTFIICDSIEDLKSSRTNQDPSSLPVVLIKNVVRPFVLSLSDFKKFMTAVDKYESERKLPSARLSFKYLDRLGQEETIS